MWQPLRRSPWPRQGGSHFAEAGGPDKMATTSPKPAALSRWLPHRGCHQGL